MNTTEVREKIHTLSDETYRQFHSKLLPGVERITGVRMPQLRSLAKEIAAGDWQGWFQELQDQYPLQSETRLYEETMLRGLVICSAKMPLWDRLPHVADFVPEISNWAVCDCFCGSLKDTKKDLPAVWDFLQPYLHSEKEYELRFGAVMLLGYFITEEYIDQALTILTQIRHDAYYVKMAVAWALSMCYVKFPEKTHALLMQNQNSASCSSLRSATCDSSVSCGEPCLLDDFTFNKTIQKICESYRVDKDTKAVLRQMKRKKR